MKMINSQTNNKKAGKLISYPEFGMSSIYIVATGGAGFLFHSINLFASTSSASINVTASVPTNCKFNSASNNFYFGSYDTLSATPLNVNGSTVLRCTKNTTVNLSINNGLHASGPQRRMFDGQNQYLNYQIYTTAARTTIWNASNTVTLVTPTSSDQTVTLYGQIPAGQNSGINGYSDTITVTATF